jgi:DNA-binding response OmpR family regulator
MNRILIVEDEKLMLDLISDYLEIAGYKVFKAMDGEEGLALFEENEIDLVILDVMMPKMDGFSLCRRIRKQSDVFIIMLTAREEDDDQMMGYELGADEYIIKPYSPKVLVAKVNRFFERRLEKSISRSNIEVILSEHRVLINKEEIELTNKEFDLLFLLMVNENKVMERELILNKVWGYDYFGDGRVLDTNIKTLRKKLGTESQVIKTVIGKGYKFEVKK